MLRLPYSQPTSERNLERKIPPPPFPLASGNFLFPPLPPSFQPPEGGAGGGLQRQSSLHPWKITFQRDISCFSLHSLLHNYYFREDGIITINLFKFKIHLSALNKSLYKYTNSQFFIITLNVLNLNSTLNFKQVIFSIHKQINNNFFFIDIRHKKHIRWDFSRVLDLSRFVWLLDYVYYCTVCTCMCAQK